MVLPQIPCFVKRFRPRFHSLFGGSLTSPAHRCPAAEGVEGIGSSSTQQLPTRCTAPAPPTALDLPVVCAPSPELRIAKVEKEIDQVKSALSGGPAYLGTNDRDFLLGQLEHLQGRLDRLETGRQKIRQRRPLWLLWLECTKKCKRAGLNQRTNIHLRRCYRRLWCSSPAVAAAQFRLTHYSLISDRCCITRSPSRFRKVIPAPVVLRPLLLPLLWMLPPLLPLLLLPLLRPLHPMLPLRLR